MKTKNLAEAINTKSRLFFIFLSHFNTYFELFANFIDNPWHLFVLSREDLQDIERYLTSMIQNKGECYLNFIFRNIACRKGSAQDN